MRHGWNTGGQAASGTRRGTSLPGIHRLNLAKFQQRVTLARSPENCDWYYPKQQAQQEQWIENSVWLRHDDGNKSKQESPKSKYRQCFECSKNKPFSFSLARQEADQAAETTEDRA